MKKVLKILGIVFGVFVVIFLAGAIYFNIAFPKADPAPNVKVDTTPERIARGDYLANHVAICMDCHSKRDWTKYAGPLVPGTFGGGGDVFDENIGFPGKITVKNITPGSVGNWTDGELIRAITCGVTKDNKPLFPIMPYTNYNKLTQEDTYSLISYIRGLAPIQNDLPDHDLNFPLNYIVKTMTVERHRPMVFNNHNPQEYGEYLVTIASCRNCHTQSEKGTPRAGMDFAGGEEFQFPFGMVRSANITPDKMTGLGDWTRETFIKRFKDYLLEANKSRPVKENEFNTPMPWLMYAGMTEKDLSAIYDYLKTVKPVRNQVERFTPKNVAMK